VKGSFVDRIWQVFLLTLFDGNELLTPDLLKSYSDLFDHFCVDQMGHLILDLVFQGFLFPLDAVPLPNHDRILHEAITFADILGLVFYCPRDLHLQLLHQCQIFDGKTH